MHVHRLLESLGRFLDKVKIDTMNTTGNITVFSYQTFSHQLQNVNCSSFEGQTFNVDLGSVEEAMNITGRIDNSALITVENSMDPLKYATAAIHIPKNLLEHCTPGENTCTQRISYSVFLFDTFFRPQNSLKKIDSLIIAVRLKCGENGTLPVAVNATFQSSNNVISKDITHIPNLMQLNLTYI